MSPHQISTQGTEVGLSLPTEFDAREQLMRRPCAAGGRVRTEPQKICARVLLRHLALVWSSPSFGNGGSSFTKATRSFTSPVVAAETNCSTKWRARSFGWGGGVEFTSNCALARLAICRQFASALPTIAAVSA